MAAIGAEEENRQLAADEFTAAAGENGRPADQPCAVLLAVAGKERPGAAAVRGDGVQDCHVTGGNG